MKLIPRTLTERKKTALYAVAAPMVILTAANLVAYLICTNSRVGTRRWFLSDGYIQAFHSEPYTVIQGISFICTLALSFTYLSKDRKLAEVGILVIIFSSLVSFFTPVIIHS